MEHPNISAPHNSPDFNQLPTTVAGLAHRSPYTNDGWRDDKSIVTPAHSAPTNYIHSGLVTPASAYVPPATAPPTTYVPPLTVTAPPDYVPPAVVPYTYTPAQTFVTPHAYTPYAPYTPHITPKPKPVVPVDVGDIKGLTGIWNKGNTCYMNSAIQALGHNYLMTSYLFKDEVKVRATLRANAKKITKDVEVFKPEAVSPIPLELREKLASDDFDPSTLTEEEAEYIYKVSMTGQLTQLLKFMWARNCSVIPTSFKAVFSEACNRFFAGYEQHDIGEAFFCIEAALQEELAVKSDVKIHTPFTPGLGTYVQNLRDIMRRKASLLDKGDHQAIDAELTALAKRMPDEALIISAYGEMRKYYSSSYSRITEIFTGFLAMSTRCPKPECGFSSHRFEPFTSISLPMPTDLPAGTVLTLEHCLEEYSKNEVLDEHNMWTCDGCNEKVPAHKRATIWEPAPTMALQINRFSMDRSSKDKRHVEYPTTGLDLAPYITPQNLNPNATYTYRLQCVANHVGSLTGGHYYSYCLDDDSLRWFKYDDHIVSELELKQIVTATAYILFYMREDLIVSKPETKTEVTKTETIETTVIETNATA